MAHRLITPLVDQSEQDISGVLISPKWRHSIDEQHFSSHDSHIQISRSSDIVNDSWYFIT
jgi:hypothetical protein